MASSPELTRLVAAVISSVQHNNLDDSLEKLRSFFPEKLLLASLDLIDRECVIKYNLPWGRTMYEVFGSTANYSVFLKLSPNTETSMSYCTCPAFAYSALLSGSQLMCKHLLATLLAERLSKCVERPINQDDLAMLVYRQCS